VRQEFTCHVCNLLVLLVILDGFLIIRRLRSAKLHEVNTDAVVSQCLTVDIANSPANLEELFILFYCCLVLSQVVK
jgi:hypothetical protein